MEENMNEKEKLLKNIKDNKIAFLVKGISAKTFLESFGLKGSRIEIETTKQKKNLF